MNSINVVERSTSQMVSLDLESKLLQSNIIFITEEITADSVATYQAELLYLTSNMTPEDSEENPIQIYINSPGGSCYSFLGLYDVMQKYIEKGYVIKTVNIGLAASAAAFILLAGSPGYRFVMPNCTTMLHQPSGWNWGTVTDMDICHKELLRLKEVLNNIVKKHADPSLIEFMERDKWLNAEEALQYKIVDKIL